MKFSNQAIVNSIATYGSTELVKVTENGMSQLVKYYSGRDLTNDDIARWKYEYQIAKNNGLHCLLTPTKFINEQQQLAIYFNDAEGVSLGELIQQETLNEQQKITLALNIVNALTQLHENNVIHRNLNLDGVLVDPTTLTVKFIDLTLGTAHNASQLSQSSLTYWQCWDYLAPELTGRTRLNIDHRTDIYVLGCIFYHLFSNTKPFDFVDKNTLVHAHITQKPESLSNLQPDLPPMLMAVINKMMEKSPDDRYQSTFGIHYDLEQIAQGNALPKVGISDYSLKLLWPQKLYGRKNELSQLNKLLNKADSVNQLAMVSGYSGIGKTVLVDELQSSIIEQGGFLLKGKCEQFGGGKPYGVFAEAFEPLFSYFSSLSEIEISQWQYIFEQSLDENIGVVPELIPQFSSIFKIDKELPPLPASEQDTRFKNSMAVFINTISQKLGKLVIFLDDLQWADTSTIKLMEHLFVQGKSSGTFVLGAYRSNEVSKSHPLSLSLNNISQAQGEITEIVLNHLTQKDVSQLLQDALHQAETDVSELVNISLSKTKGNPFFLHQFVNSLADENILHFALSKGRWNWDVKEILEQDITENVVELVVQQLQKLPDITQHLLTYAAHLGSQFTMSVISEINETDLAHVANYFAGAIEQGFLIPLTDDFQFNQSPKLLEQAKFRFSHDRVQQAAFALTPESAVNKMRQHVGLKLLSYCQKHNRFDEYLFTLLEQLNPVKSQLAPDLSQQLIDLNLSAAEKAKNSSAFSLALNYAQQAESLLPDNSWFNEADLALRVYRELAEINYLAGQFEDTESLCKQQIELAQSNHAKVTLSMILIQLLQTQMRFPEALDAAQNALQLLGLRLPDDEETSLELLQQEFEQVETEITRVDLNTMIDLPEITKESVLQLLALYESALNPCYLIGRQYTYCLVATRMTQLTLEHGQCDITSIAIRSYMMTRARLQRPYPECYEVGKLACQFAEKYDNRFYTSAVYQVFYAGYQTWIEPMHQSFSPLRTTVDWGFEGINIVYAGYASLLLCSNLMVKGLPLKQVMKDVERGQALFAHTHQPMGSMYMSVMNENPIKALMGEALDPISADTQEFSVTDIFKGDYGTPSMELALHAHAMIRNGYLLHSQELQQRFVPLLPLIEAFMPDSTLVIDSNFYSGLAYISWAKTDPGNRSQHLEQASIIVKKFETWQHDCPANYSHRYLLLKAELAALNEQHLEAQSLYSQAINSAQEAEFYVIEAVANEGYAYYWQSQNQHNTAALFIRQAHSLYKKWQAEAKVEQIENQWSQVSFYTDQKSDFDNLDLTTMLEVNQILSSEIKLENLLDKLILITIQNAGADRACLLTLEDEQIFLRASGDIHQRHIHENLTLELSQTRELLPSSVIKKAGQAEELLLIDRPNEQYEYFNESYFKKRQPLTLVCVPIMYQGKLFGFLYLENYATANAFNTAQVNLLESIAVQAAVSLSNALVYKTLEQRVVDRTQDLEVAKQKAEEATVSKSNFLANMSHEIRTPMNAVIGLSRLAMRTELNPEQQDFINKILASSESLLGLINDILDFSKIEAGKMTLEETSFELDKVIQQGVGVCNLKAHEKSIELITYVEPNIPNLLFGDPTRIQQVITNLVSNAVKFTEQGTVTVEVLLKSSTPNIELQFKVTDSGIGISPEQQKRLFQSFAQADESVTRKYGGTGLGLAICKQLVEMMGGNIGVISEIGQGSIFTFNINLTAIEIAKRAAKSIDNELSTLNVLAVDDNALSRKAILDTLAASGISAQSVNGGQQAIEAVKTSIKEDQPYDLILLDWKMPEVDGVETARVIRQELNHSSPNILMVSAYDKDELKKRTHNIAVDGFIEKPLNQNTLIEHIKKLIAGKQTLNIESHVTPAPNLLDYEILLVEDNAINRQVTLGFLADCKVKVDIAENGQIALDKTKEKQYDLILMDIQMPVMDGLTATRLIRSELKSNVPIIAMTAHAMESDAQKSLQSGMNAHLAKPIDPDLLFNTLSQYLTPVVDTRIQTEKNDNSAVALETTSPILQQPLLNLLRKVPHLFVDEAINKLKGKVKLYEGLIKDFARNNKSLSEQIDECLNDQNQDELFRLVHSLKSSAAYIGAEQLSKEANLIEQMLSNGKAAEDQIRLLTEQTSILVSHISNVLEQGKKDVIQQSLTPHETSELLEEIRIAATEFNVDAEEMAEQLYQALVGTAYEEMAQQVFDELNNFEYENALIAIEKLAQEIVKKR